MIMYDKKILVLFDGKMNCLDDGNDVNNARAAGYEIVVLGQIIMSLNTEGQKFSSEDIGRRKLSVFMENI